jgi:membrane fusion protein (multidrug efflux system)
VGVRQDGMVEIVAGLAPRERIVADGVNRINPNQPLRPAGEGRRNAAAPGAGGQGRAAP